MPQEVRQSTDELLLAQFLAGVPSRRLLALTKCGQPSPSQKRTSEAAFAELVARHGPLVLAVCRRTLGNRTDAEDAFQATFLVLSRKARSLRNAASLPAWLYQTAYRLALRARAARAKRRELPLENEAMIAPDTLRHIAHDYEQSLLDDELDKLPEKYRLPVFLCCLEGKSLEAAAAQLGWSTGSVKGRLERGRTELRRRLLLRRGAPAVAVALAFCLPKAASAAATVPPTLAAATVSAGTSYAAGKSLVGTVSHQALSLAQGSTHAMIVFSTKFAACAVLSVGLLSGIGTQFSAPVQAGGTGGSRPVIELQTSVAASQVDVSTLAAAPQTVTLSGGALAFADGERPREGAPRDGDRPREGAARDGDAPRSTTREGAPREGAREGAPREGVREGVGREGMRNQETANDPLRNFRPANQREAALVQMIQALRSEVAALRAQVQSRRMGSIEGDGEGARDGAREGAREGDGVRKSTGPRDGESPKAGPRDGESPRTGARDGESPQRKGDAPKRDGEAPKRDGN
ncbi:MAG: sigma-70 family RNA polymerase sigma factor [Planctomycetales bacterium]|nr:sigma-70 family RNA polymerase sigma factor [Planctomycetales bacterium]MBN8627648.1 sigma-70 family RNA polymerase sigma factor [Planctomycetota bacterium]